MAPPFFLPQTGGTLLATASTSGPWSAQHQHGGPPTALLVRAIEEQLAPEFFLARVLFEFARPVPVAALRCACQAEQRGRSVERWKASLLADGVEVLRVSALALRRVEGLPEVAHDPPPPLLPEQCPAIRFPFRWSDVSYADAIEVRAASGEHGSGAMAAWLRPLVPLVEGESTSPLQRLLCVADAANGVSAPLPYDAYTFVNPDLTVALCRPPEGDWILIDARTSVDPGGIGLVDARLADARGYVGRALQTLVVRPRSAAEQAPARG
jgi:hypothetical protein